MDKKRDKAINLLKAYINELGKNGIHINSAILFGSYAKGKYDEWSDIDVALVSDNFTGNRFIDKDNIRKFKSKFSYSISPLPYRTADFTRDNLFVDEILATGIKVI